MSGMSSRFPSRSILVVVLLCALVVTTGLGVLYIRQHPPRHFEHPEYYNFNGYVFTVPKYYNTDELAIPGMQLVYPGTLPAKTLDDVYSFEGISVRSLDELPDNHSDTFKSYVEQTFVPGLKNDPSAQSIQTDLVFTKSDNWDAARITVTKDGKPYRFIYIKNGRHPVVVTCKDETDAFKKIEQTLLDVEDSDLKNDAAAIKQSLQSIAQYIKDQNAQAIYEIATPELKSKNSLNDVAADLKTVVSIKDDLTIEGGGYDANDFSVVLNFNSKDQPVIGALYLNKIDGSWKLKGFKLPGQSTPTPSPAPASAPAKPSKK